ncbi:hypothetical protein QJS10_CPA05g01545 [Acorus calamus]|uniref:Uncharacterized protein n=1 Tax=Acorus calamus TaxID=4465 RepID=A0AAV9EV73_ACOCL|nr:hypothetical protein QJS10_CPA05g01545 [Acorus calamus]
MRTNNTHSRKRKYSGDHLALTRFKLMYKYIPFNFVKKYISSETQDIILSDSNRRKCLA